MTLRDAAYTDNLAANMRAVSAMMDSMFPWAQMTVRPSCEDEVSCRLCGDVCPKTGQSKQQERED
jgi:hypothetical protein